MTGWRFPVLTDHTDRPVVLAVHDGDTVRLALDAGVETGAHPWLRVRDAYCPELDEPGGPEAQAFTLAALTAASAVSVTLHGRSFARWVADVHVDGRSLADLLIEAGHATPEPADAA